MNIAAQTRLEMTKISWFSRLHEDRASRPRFSRITTSVVTAGLLVFVVSLAAQSVPATPATASAAPAAPATPVAVDAPAVPTAPDQVPDEVHENGYVVRQTADLGGHLVGISGSSAMYDTLVNLHSGPRVLGQTFTMHAVGGTKHPLIDSLEAFSNGFGGDPINFARLSFYKGKLYEFTGTFRRDRQYFDYDLLANPSIPSGITTPYGMVDGVPTTASLAQAQVNQSPVLFNTGRRMTDTSLTILPLSRVSFRISYSQNIFQGPSLSPGYSIGTRIKLLLDHLHAFL